MGGQIDIQQTAFLVQGLSLGQSQGDSAAAIVSLADEAAWTAMIAAGQVNDLLPAVADRLAPHCFPDDAAPGPEPVASYTERQLREYLVSHRYRCAMQRARLIEVVRAMNSRGIEPVLMTCAHALWCEEPRWRHARDLGILVDRHERAGVSAAVSGLGYSEVRKLDRSGYRNETHWLRPDLCGWIAVRSFPDNARLETLLPANEHLRLSLPVAVDGAVVRLLPPHALILHAMLHHQFGHGFGLQTRVTLKALYEFAWAMTRLSEADHAALWDRARRHRTLADVLQAWCDAAVRFLALPPRPHREFGVAVASEAQPVATRAALEHLLMRCNGRRTPVRIPVSGPHLWI